MKLIVSFLNEGFEKKLQSMDTENCENKKSLSEFIQDLNSDANTDDVELDSLDDLDFNAILEEDVLEEKKADQRFGFGNKLKFRPYNVYFFNGLDKLVNDDALKLAGGTRFKDGFRIEADDISGNKLSADIIKELNTILEKSNDSIQSYIVFGEDTKKPVFDSMSVDMKAKQDQHTQNTTLHVWKFDRHDKKHAVEKDVDIPGLPDNADTVDEYRLPLQKLALNDNDKYFYQIRSDNGNILYDTLRDKEARKQAQKEVQPDGAQDSSILHLYMLFNPHSNMDIEEEKLHKEPFDLHPVKHWRVDVPNRWTKRLSKFINALYAKNVTIDYGLRDFRKQKQDVVVFMLYEDDLNNPKFVPNSEASNYTDDKGAIKQRILEWLKATDGATHEILGNPDQPDGDPSKKKTPGSDDPQKTGDGDTGKKQGDQDTDTKSGEGWDSVPDDIKKLPAVQKAVVDAKKQDKVKKWELNGDILTIYFSDGSAPFVHNIKDTGINTNQDAKAGEGWDSLPSVIKKHPFIEQEFDTEEKQKAVTTWILSNRELTIDLNDGKSFKHKIGEYGTSWNGMPKAVKEDPNVRKQIPEEKRFFIERWYIIDDKLVVDFGDGSKDISVQLKGRSNGTDGGNGTSGDGNAEGNDKGSDSGDGKSGDGKNNPKDEKSDDGLRGPLQGKNWESLPDAAKKLKAVQDAVVTPHKEKLVDRWIISDGAIWIHFSDNSQPFEYDVDKADDDGFRESRDGTDWKSLPEKVKNHPKVKKAVVDKHKENKIKKWFIRDGLLYIQFSDGTSFTYYIDEDWAMDDDQDKKSDEESTETGKGKGKGKGKGQETGEESDEETDEDPDEEADNEEDSDEDTDETGDGEGKSVEKDKNYHKGKGWDKLPLEIKKTDGVKKEIIGEHRVEVVGDWEYNDELVSIKFTDNSEEYTGDRTITVKSEWDKDDIGYGWEMLPDWAREKNPDVQKEIVQKQLKNKVGYWTLSDDQLIIEFTDGRKKLVIKLKGERPHGVDPDPVEDPEEGEDPSENPDEPEKPEDEDTEEPEETSDLDDTTDNWLKMYALNRTGTGKTPGKGIEQSIPSGTGAEEIKKKLSAASMNPENKDKSDVYVVNPKTRKIDYVARNGKVADIAKSLKEALKSDFDSLKR